MIIGKQKEDMEKTKKRKFKERKEIRRINLADTKDHKLVILVRILCLQKMVYGGGP